MLATWKLPWLAKPETMQLQLHYATLRCRSAWKQLQSAGEQLAHGHCPRQSRKCSACLVAGPTHSMVPRHC